jgi:hypothetical protein
MMFGNYVQHPHYTWCEIRDHVILMLFNQLKLKT